MAQRDFYEILDVPRDATADQIKKAYRTLARKHHPDVNPGDKAAEAKFKEAQSAYDALSDPETRKRYDMFGHAGMQGGGGGPRESAQQWSASQAPPGFENIDFRQFFGGGAEAPEASGGMFDELLGRFGSGRGRRSGPRRGADLEATLSIPFATAILGGPTTIEFAREDGTRQSLEVRIPPGTDNGAKLRLKGRGGPGEANAPAGDLTITISVQTHAYFRRDGRDVLLDLPISIDEAVLGAKVDVPMLAGSTVSLNIPPGTSSGQKLRVRGKGVPAHGDKPEGDMFVITKIVVPRNVDEESRKLIQTFAEQNPMKPRENLW